MKSLWPLILALGAIAVIFFNFKSPRSSPPQGQKYTVILSPYGSQNDQGQWQGEIGPFMNRLTQAVNVSPTLSLCDQAYTGYISSQPVLVVVSGIGKVKTTACTSQILQAYPSQIKDVVVSGIGGISVAHGTSLGDLCINSITTDFDRQYYSSGQFWTQPLPTPPTASPTQLAQDLYRVAVDLPWPDPPSSVSTTNSLYRQSTRPPKVWSPQACMEVSGDLFWHDPRADGRARELASELLNSKSVVVITSMESDAVGSLVRWHNSARKTNIGFAYVRGASNFSYPPTPATSARDSLEQTFTFDSAQYAAKSAALPILKLLDSQTN